MPTTDISTETGTSGPSRRSGTVASDVPLAVPPSGLQGGVLRLPAGSPPRTGAPSQASGGGDPASERAVMERCAAECLHDVLGFASDRRGVASDMVRSRLTCGICAHPETVNECDSCCFRVCRQCDCWSHVICRYCDDCCTRFNLEDRCMEVEQKRQCGNPSCDVSRF